MVKYCSHCSEFISKDIHIIGSELFDFYIFSFRFVEQIDWKRVRDMKEEFVW